MPNVYFPIFDNSSIIFEGEAIALIVLHIPKHSNDSGGHDIMSVRTANNIHI